VTAVALPCPIITLLAAVVSDALLKEELPTTTLLAPVKVDLPELYPIITPFVAAEVPEFA
jgi:hypothetical protein